MKKAAPVLRVMAFAIQVTALSGGVPLPALQTVDAIIGNTQCEQFANFANTLNEIAPDAYFDALVKDNQTGEEAIDEYLRNSVSSRRAAFLAIREALGENNVVSTCGLKQQRTAEGVIWILDNEVVDKAFLEGKTRDEARSLLANWNAQQTAAASAAKTDKRSQFAFFGNRS